MDKRCSVQGDGPFHCPPNAIIWFISKKSSFWSVPNERSGEAIVGPPRRYPAAPRGFRQILGPHPRAAAAQLNFSSPWPSTEASGKVAKVVTNGYKNLNLSTYTIFVYTINSPYAYMATVLLSICFLTLSTPTL